MMTVLGVSLMVFAAVVFVWGLDVSGTVQFALSRISRGIPRDDAGWLFAGSVIAAVMGMGLILSNRSRTA